MGVPLRFEKLESKNQYVLTPEELLRHQDWRRAIIPISTDSVFLKFGLKFFLTEPQKGL
ncbi:MAG: hypothetical protein JW836_03230 [Deltaproteobacteria bacterium]|nr:hypothetical protein [Deltaproteobacteria bacterium]